MSENLDLEVESPESRDSYEEDATDEEATREVLDMLSGKDEGIESPSSKYHLINEGGPSHGRKKMVRCTLHSTVIPGEKVVQLATHLLTTAPQPRLGRCFN